LRVSERSANVQDAYQADSDKVQHKSVLIMDDVATTGSTISACTAALLSARAKEVYVLTIARALPHHSLDRV
jgi:predicted amidophosphoribosyltransferase